MIDKAQQAEAIVAPSGDAWSISLPYEDPFFERILEARNSSGAVVARWRYNGNEWTCIWCPLPHIHVRVTVGYSYLFNEVVSECIARDWRLYAVPDDIEPASER